MKVLHVINSTDIGGAEKILFNLVKSQSNKEVIIISLTKEGFIGRELIKKGYKVHYLNFQKNISVISKWIKFIFLIKKYNPEIVHSWLYHSNLIGGLSAKLMSVKKIYWSIHHDYEFSSKRMQLELKILGLMSYFIPNKVVYCSYNSKINHINNGFSNRNSSIIENGVCTNKFKKNFYFKKIFRRKLNIEKDHLIIGNIARYHPIKDHETLLKSLKILKSKKVKFKCILIGNGLTKVNQNLAFKIRKYKLQNRVILLGELNEVNKILNCFDINILSSKSECAPVTLMEAMATGIPSISTKVGDAKNILGDTGWVIKVGDHKALAEHIEQIYKNKNLLKEKSTLALNRAKTFFSLELMLSKYKKLYNM